MVQCAKFVGKPIEECTRTWNCPCSTEKPQPKQSASGWQRYLDSAASFVECKAGDTCQQPCITYWEETAEIDAATWNRFLSATQAIIKERHEAAVKSADTPTKQHLNPDTAPRNSSSS